MVAAPETQQLQQNQDQIHSGDAVAAESLKQSIAAKDNSKEQGIRTVDGLAVVDKTGSVSPASSANASEQTHNLPPPEVARNIPCRFFPLGTCKYGEQCIFSHGIPGVAGSPGVPASPSVQSQVAPSANSQEQQQQQRQLQPQGHEQQAQQSYLQQQQQHYPHAHLHQQALEQQVVPSPMDHAYMQGVPMYYPEQALQYGFQPPFSPEQAYYHFAPPPFQPYPQHYQQFAPHAYYAPPPPPPPHMAAPLAVSTHQLQQQQPQQPPASAAVDATLSSPVAPSQAASPAQADDSSSTSPADAAASQSSAVPASTSAETNGFAPAAALASSPSQALGPDGLPLPRTPASLHTFFQTSSPMTGPATTIAPSAPSPSASIPAPLPVVSSSPNGFMKPLPGRAAGPQRSIGGLASGPYPAGSVAGGAKPRRSFGGSRPPCSFFEANRCKNGDECSFVHMLPDGSDARALGRGMIGSDGRTDSPEATGGTPPAWLINQRALRFQGANGQGGSGSGANLKKHHEAGMGSNGASFNYRERSNVGHQGANAAHARGRYDEEQQARYAARQQVAHMPAQFHDGQGQVQPGLVPQAPPAGLQPHALADGSLAGRIPPGGAPQLVAAINGLTRRIPPAHLHQHGQQGQAGSHESSIPMSVASTPAQSREPSQQRVPTVNDFPALGSPAAPLSPAVEKDAYTNVVESSSAVSAAKAKDETPVPAASGSPTAENDGFVLVSHADAAPSPVVDSTAATTSEKLPVQSEEPAAVPASTPAPATTTTESAAPASRPAPTPKLMVSFASIAKAASAAAVEKVKPASAPSPSAGPTSKVSEPPAKVVPVQTKPVKEEAPVPENDGFETVTKTSKKSKKAAARASSATASQVMTKA
ncbi:uncharacterized protein JCM15063_005313 [Sporobolomyces koalae]|uniref:uncharacterized protein n=1 Tax=Sporobolomyces koalae TaxID=500713 RepID=UPI00317B37D1